jgi:hypothetical protein
VIVDELPAAAEVGDGGYLTGGDPGRDVAGELGQIVHVVRPLDRYLAVIAG